MSTIPANTRFIGISESVDLTERKSAQANTETEAYTMQDIVDTVSIPTTNFGLYSQTENSTPITNTTTQLPLFGNGVGSLSIPSNIFSVGDSFHAKLNGHLSCVNSATIRLRIVSGAIILADTGIISLSTATNRHWDLNLDFTVRTLGGPGVASIASGGVFSYIRNASNNFEGVDFSIVNNTTFDTTVSNTLSVTAEWGSANTNDIIYSEIFTLNKTF